MEWRFIWKEKDEYIDCDYASSDGTLKTDGAYYYNMDATDGHYLGSFPVN